MVLRLVVEAGFDVNALSFPLQADKRADFHRNGFFHALRFAHRVINQFHLLPVEKLLGGRRDFPIMHDFEDGPVRRVFDDADGSREIFRRQGLFPFRLFVHVLVADIAGVFVDHQIVKHAA